MNQSKLALGLCMGAAIAALGGGGAAFAADDNKTDGASQVQELVVTGSRIGRSTFTTPNPVSVIGPQEIQNLGLTNVGAVVAELPQNSNFFAGNNVGLGNFNVGAQLANLRGLNPFFGTRTLTMIDTHRVVPTTTGGGVDITLVPSILVARTEVVTGGASAVYGSDAVAGVVNIILDTKLQGLQGHRRLQRHHPRRPARTGTAAPPTARISPAARATSSSAANTKRATRSACARTCASGVPPTSPCTPTPST